MANTPFGSLSSALGQQPTQQQPANPQASVQGGIADPYVRSVLNGTGADGIPLYQSFGGSDLSSLPFGGGSASAAMIPDNRDYFPAASIPIQKGAYSGSILGSMPIFTPNIMVPFAVAEKKRNAALEEANRALFNALKPIDLSMPQAKHPKFQQMLSDRFFPWLEGWMKRSQNIPGGMDNLLSGRTQQSIEFKREYNTFEMFRRYSDALVDRAAEISKFETDYKIRIDPKTRDAYLGILSGLNGIGFDNFADDMPKHMAMLEMSKSLHGLIEPPLNALRTQIEERVGNVVPGSQQWFAETTNVLNDLLPDSNIEAIARQIAYDNPWLVYSKDLDQQLGSSDPAFKKGDQPYTVDDVKHYFQALIPPHVRESRQIITKPGSGGSVSINNDLGKDTASSAAPDWLLHTWLEGVNNPSDESLSVLSKTDENNFSIGGDGVVAYMSDGEVMIHPRIDFRSNVSSALNIASGNKDNTFGDPALTMSLLGSADGSSMATRIYNGLNQEGFDYASRAQTLRNVIRSQNIEEKIRTWQAAADSGGGVLLPNGTIIRNVNNNVIFKGKKAEQSVWNMTISTGIGGETKSGVLVPLADIGGDAVMDRISNGISLTIGSSGLSPQGPATEYAFLFDVYYRDLGNGTWQIVDKQGSAYRPSDNVNEVVTDMSSVNAHITSSIDKYADAYERGARMSQDGTGYRPNINRFSQLPDGSDVVQGSPISLQDQKTATEMFTYFPPTLEQFDQQLQYFQQQPDNLLWKFDASRPQSRATDPERGMLGGYGIPEPISRYLVGFVTNLNSGANSEVNRIYKQYFPDRYNTAQQAKIQAGGALNLRQVYSEAHEILNLLYQSDPKIADQFFQDAVNSTTQQYDSGQLTAILYGSAASTRQ